MSGNAWITGDGSSERASGGASVAVSQLVDGVGADGARHVADRAADLDALAEGLAALRGSLMATECLVTALALRLPAESRVVVYALLETEAEAYRTALAASDAALATVTAFERHVARMRDFLSDGFDRLSQAGDLTA